MLKLLKSLSIEVTRRCNQTCSHCMRGEAENVDASLENIDLVLNEDDMIINRLVFSGGEPTLVPEIIIYTIDKIIKERKRVLSIHMTTNGLIYSEDLIDAFKRYIEYSKRILSGLTRVMEIDKIVDIRISNDQFHQKISHSKYQEINNPDIHVSETGPLDILDDEVLRTGRYKNGLFGRYFSYDLPQVKVYTYQDLNVIDNDFYLTATGFITNRGDGEYLDMDAINFGRVDNFSFDKLIQDTAPYLKK